MIKDYSVYELTVKEKIIVYVVGYICAFSLVYLFYHSIPLSLLAGGTIYFIVPYVKEYMAGRRQNALNIQFKDMLYSLSASVAAGRQMEEALIEAESNLSTMYHESEPIMRELKHMRISIVENNENDKLLLKDFAFRSRNEDINDFVQVYITCRNMGGNLEKIISRATDILIDKITIEKEIRVLMSQKKTEGILISVMPLVMLLGLNIFSYSYISPLYETAAGRIIMTASLGVTMYGMYMMKKISDIKV